MILQLSKNNNNNDDFSAYHCNPHHPKLHPSPAPSAVFALAHLDVDSQGLI